jgi:hypothetical protein
VRENGQIFDAAGQLQHSAGTVDVTVDREVDSGIEVDARSAVDDHVAATAQLFEDFLRESEAFLLEVALSELGEEYIGCTFCWMNSSKRPLCCRRMRSKQRLLTISFLNLSRRLEPSFALMST